MSIQTLKTSLHATTRLSSKQHLIFSTNLFPRSFSNHQSSPDNEEELTLARQWYTRFLKSHSTTIPSKLAKTTFSRSSGPGGQKVNKTSSKATTTWSLPTLSSHLPRILSSELSKSRFYVESSDSLSMQSDSHRGQSENEAENHRKLKIEIEEIYERRVPGETSVETRRKHVEFQKAANSARLKNKKMHSERKRSRSNDF